MQPAACSLYMPVYASNMAGALQERVVDVQVYRLRLLLAGTPATSPGDPRRKPPTGISNFHPISQLS